MKKEVYTSAVDRARCSCFFVHHSLILNIHGLLACMQASLYKVSVVGWHHRPVLDACQAERLWDTFIEDFPVEVAFLCADAS
jgi:hypothetical protein